MESLEDALKRVESLKEWANMKPENQKKELMRIELQQIFRSSEWYSARYAAGKALGMNHEELDRQVITWASELEVELAAKKEEIKHITYKELEHVYFPVKRYYDEYDDEYIEVWKEKEEISHVVDKDKRLRTIRDIGELYKLSKSPLARSQLRRVYNEEDIPQLRREAGRELGYNEFRIWIQVHPITIISAGILIATTVFILIFR